jgi:CheY-like chemotaxis protein
LINLLSNATKFTKNGKIELFVMVSKQISPIKSRLRFEVRDNGIGISNDSLHKIFDSFTQASSSTTRQYGGTGLGLPISKRIVELLGGEIWVESKLGEGSSFFVELPIGHKEISENIKLNSLVVEDFEMTQMLLEKTFESLDISCAFVDDYDTWQERVLAVQYSFVIIDVTKEGFEWAKIKDFILDHHLMEHTNLLIFNNEYFEEMQQMGIVVISQPINKNEIQAIKEMIVSGRNG